MNQAPSPTPNPTQSIYPTPQEQEPTPNPPANQPAPRKDNTLKIILIGLGGCLVLFVIIFFLLGGMTLVGLNSARDKAKDARIKSSVQQTRSTLEVYYSDNNTYVGYTVDPTLQSDVQENGSRLIVQSLGQNTFVIYAELPATEKIYCIDNAGFSGEVENIPKKNTCR